MKRTFHGVFSLLLLVLAVALAMAALWRHSPGLGLFYLALCSLSSVGILFAYCGKCSVRLDNCSHVLPGKLTNWLPQRKQGPYSARDIGGTLLCLAAITLFPQYWLLQDRGALVLFWLLAIVALAEILMFVCRQCKNTGCPMCELLGSDRDNT